MNPIYDYILSQATINGCRPRIAKVLFGESHFGLAWNTNKFYVDIETYEKDKQVSITITWDRKHLDIIDLYPVDDPATYEPLNECLDRIFKRIKEIQNEN